MTNMEENRLAINRKMLELALMNAEGELGEDKESYITRVLEKDDVLSIDYEGEIFLENERGEQKQFRKKEKTTCYPLGDWTMYESKFDFFEKQTKKYERVYNLVLLTPSGEKIDCNFFDTQQIVELGDMNSEYVALVKNEALRKMKSDDADALMRFVKGLAEHRYSDEETVNDE